LETSAHASILQVQSSLRAPATARLRREIEALLDRGERRIELDLSRLTDIDAAGVGELVRAFTTTSAAGGEMRISHAQRRVRRLLDIAGVLNVLSEAIHGADRVEPEPF
jgi:anti-anti-sigma factor